ncbi:hypothetical protein WA026_022218 [Henosepilachna vigintioctopunctata]|uniref:Uncharacterized protein n=1 Tax=Henosepilachna vigintioctopunctata TaxID=420089 RepID=A0AAW1URJ4_9CUCU
MNIRNVPSRNDLMSHLLSEKPERSFYSEFYRARFRFYEIFHTEGMNEEEKKLDDIIYKICTEANPKIELYGINSDLFLKILFRADFLQISDDVKNNFYKNVCIHFIFSDIISEIIKRIGDLDRILHVKVDILRTLLKMLNVQAIIDKRRLTLENTRFEKYDIILFERIDEIIISPCAYKIMCSNDAVNLHHINFILKLFKVTKLTLNGCNLNWKNEGNLLNNLSLSQLFISQCGSSVNRIILENVEALEDSLRVLDVSDCPLYNETLIAIRNFRLKKLSMRNCIKKNGYFIGDLWSESMKFGSYIEANVNMNLLWQEGTLKDTLKYLDVSSNDLIHEELDVIKELKVKELHLSKTNIKLNTQLNNGNTFKFPYSLRKLILKNVDIDFNFLSILCDFRLQRLEISYDAAKEFDDFSLLMEKPIVESLEELSLDLKNYSQLFVSFIANFKLKIFECKLGTWYYYNFDSFWNNSKRENLEVLILEDGKLSENDAKGISQLNTRILSIHPFLFDTKEHVLKILRSENLRNSVYDLRLGGAYEADNEHVNLISEFKNIEYLSLKITGTNLTQQLFKKLELLGTLKTLTLRICIGLNLSEEVASVLCNFPVKTELTILLVGVGKHWCLSFTENAFRHFLRTASVNQNAKVNVRLEFSDCTLNKKCAEVFKRFNVKSLTFSSCVFDQFLENFLKDEMLFSLEDITLKRVDIDSKQLELLANIHLTKLSILASNNFSYINLPSLLKSGPISKSLTTLRIDPTACIHYVENILKTKLSVYELFSWDLL